MNDFKYSIDDSQLGAKPVRISTINEPKSVTFARERKELRLHHTSHLSPRKPDVAG